MSRKHLRLGAVVTAVVGALFVGVGGSYADDKPGGGERSGENITATADNLFRPVTPCRIVDTRHGGGGAISNGQTRTFNASSNLINQGASLSDCGVPTNAKSIAANVTITGTTGFGNLRIFPASSGVPNASTINWNDSNVTVANEVNIGLSGNQFKVFGDIGGGGHTHVIVDVTGFYVEQIEGWVNSNGAIFSKSRRVISSTRTSTGHYTVTVDTNIGGSGTLCAVTANKFTNASGEVQVNTDNTNHVFLVVTNSAGTAVDSFVSFAVLC